MSTDRSHRWDIGEVLDRTDLAALLEEHSDSIGTPAADAGAAPCPTTPTTTPPSACTPTAAVTNAGDAGPATTPTEATPSTS